MLCLGARATLARLEATLVRRCRYELQETASAALSLRDDPDDIGVVVAELGAVPALDRDALLEIAEAAPHAMLVALEGRGSSQRACLEPEHLFRRMPWPCPRERVLQAVMDGVAYQVMRKQALLASPWGAAAGSPELLAEAARSLLFEGRRSDAELALRPYLTALLRYCQSGSLPLLGDVRIAIELALQLAATDTADEWLRYVFDLHSTLRLTAAHDVLERLSRIVAGLPGPRATLDPRSGES